MNRSFAPRKEVSRNERRQIDGGPMADDAKTKFISRNELEYSYFSLR